MPLAVPFDTDRLRDPALRPIAEKLQSGTRLDAADAITLFTTPDLRGVGAMADAANRARHGDRVTFAANQHINPTNICVLSCSFCDFARKKGEAGAFEHSIEDVVGMIEADVREVDLDAVLRGLTPPRTLAGNLPYHLSGLLLRRAVEVTVSLDRSVFLLQLEVVDRLCAAPGSEAYGALSVFVQAVTRPERALIVKRGAFYPQPNVDSAVAVLTPPSLQGRVSAVEWVFISASNELGAFWSGSLARLIGTVPAVVAGGVAMVGIAGAWTRLFPSLATMGKLEDLRELPAT